MATFCRKCGAHNEPDARFCESCGSPMSVSMQSAANVAPEAPSAKHQGRSQQPRRRWVLYAVGSLTILGIGIVVAAFFVPIGPLTGLASTLRGLGVTGGETTLYYVGRNGKWGYVNKAGSEVISFQYDAPPPAAKFLAAYTVIRSAAPYPVFKNGKWTLVSRDGAPLGQRVMDEMQSIPQSPAVCGRVGKHWGCVDAAGRDAIPFKYEAVGMTLEGLTAVKSNGRWGYVDKAGAVVIQPSFLYAWDFEHGRALVQFDDKTKGLIDPAGKEVSKRRYQDARIPGDDGLWLVYVHPKWIIVDLSGEIVQRFAHMDVIEPFREGLAVANLKNARLSNLIDTSGKVVATLPILSYPGPFQNGLAPIKSPFWSTYGFIRRDGHFVVPPLFDAVSGFVDGVAIVQIGTEAWTIDLTGRAIWPKEKQAIGAPMNDLERLKSWKWRVQKSTDPSFIGGTVEFGADTIHFIQTGQESIEISYRSREPGILQLTVLGKPEEYEFLAYGNELVIFETTDRKPMLLTQAEPVGKERAKAPAKESTAQGNSAFAGLPSLFGGGKPTESAAQKVWENMNEDSIKAGLWKLESFKKTNGLDSNASGISIYIIEYEAKVMFPKGLNPQCSPSMQRQDHWVELRCLRNELEFILAGESRLFKGSAEFQKTENGWRGQDGKLY